MKARLLKVVLTTIVLGVFAGTIWAAAPKSQDPNKTKTPPAQKNLIIKGIVAATKDKDSKITSVTVTTVADKTMYQIVLDTKGTELGQKMAGKTVTVTGTVETKDSVKWITVKTYIEAAKPTKKPQHTNK